ncbi:MAG: type VI secretion system baseplate subunit TssE [Pirellulales bacterium]|nr:type VI secretion system baseplate subunit TssE [Pirellulales bacterium]
MAELTPKERLQPALLDRLADNEPNKSIEARDSRVLSIERLHDCVVRDLSWLLNTENLASLLDLEEYPEVADSTLNYGVPSFSGRFLGSYNERQIADHVRESILRFEPRLLAETVQVHAHLDQHGDSQHLVSFQIEATLWAQPVPLQLLVKAEVDLETGDLNITSS